MTESITGVSDAAPASVVVLMVDDDREDVYLTRRAFRDRPRLKAFNTVDGAEQLFDYLTRCTDGDSDAPFPDLVLLDINMPGRNGFDILGVLRADARWRTLPVVMLSTSSANADVARAYACGANAFLAKPVTAAGMKQVAERVDAFWFGTALLPPSGRRDSEAGIQAMPKNRADFPIV